jgi:uncharacterized delta-60 repeat protein
MRRWHWVSVLTIGVAGMLSMPALADPGDVDFSYGSGTGKSFVNFGSSDFGGALALQPDGKIVVAGSSNGSGGFDFAVARLLNPQGTLDTTYGGGTGKSLANLAGADFGKAVALQSDGKIIVAGDSTPTGGGSADFTVARLLNPQGTIDTTYGGGTGYSVADFGGNDTGNAVALQPDGKIVVAGYTTAGGTHDFAVARFNSNGTLDTSFGSGGKSIFNLGGNDDAYSVALQSDGKIVLAGYTSAGNGNDFAVARFIGGEPTGYARPKGATPINVSLVPTYTQCTSSNRTHGPALAFPSCNPPTQQSSNLTVGTPDANGAAANSAGSVRLQTLVGIPGPPDDSDVSLALQMTDVRCKAGVSTCGPANAAGGADYTGELYVLLGVSGRMTDKFNDATGSAGASEMGTVQDFTFNGGEALCSATASTAIGATCTLNTTANTVLPGTVKDGKRAIWQLNSAIFVTDGGTDGDANSPPNQTFATQGVFVP